MTGTVRLAQASDLPQLYALRHEVFVVGQHVPLELERGVLDNVALHAIGLVDGAVVATGRLVDGQIDADGALVPGTQAEVGTIGRMAVEPALRGRGLGRAVLDLLVETAAARGLPAVELHAQLHAREFYERAGFAAYGQIYLEAGIEHVGMRREL